MEIPRLLLLTARMKKWNEAVCGPVCRRYGLTQIECDVLGFLRNNPDHDTARDITELRMLPKGNVSVAVERLREKGYLSRHADGLDRRLVHLRLEPASDAAAAELIAARDAAAARLLAQLTPEEQESWRRLTERMLAILEETEREAEGT